VIPTFATTLLIAGLVRLAMILIAGWNG